MYPIGPMWEDILSDAHRSTSPADIARLRRITRQAYYDVCRLVSWVDLRDTVDLDFSVSNSILLPANLIGIDGVRGDSDSGYREYIARDLAALEEGEDLYRWYFSEVLEEPVESANDLELSAGGTSFVADSLNTDYTDDFVKFGSESGFYKISAFTAASHTSDFTPTYYGTSMQDGYWQIRPAGTKKLGIMDPAEEDDDATVTVHYWKYPPQLYRPEDIVMLPNPRVLYLLAAIRFIGNVMKREYKANAFREELYGTPRNPGGVLADAIRQNPVFPTAFRPKGVTNETIDCDAEMFRTKLGASGMNEHFDSWRGYFE